MHGCSTIFRHILIGSIVQALRNQAEEQRKRAADVEEMARAVRSSSMSQGASNKKDEDMYDVEAGTLAPGSSSAVKPIASLMRKAPPPLNHVVVVNAARRLDRAIAVLDKRPGARAGLLLYFVLLHIYLILW